MISKFQHDAPKHPQHTPSRYVNPVYGAKTQYATKDETPHLTGIHPVLDNGGRPHHPNATK
jgi:hypothetical protein